MAEQLLWLKIAFVFFVVLTSVVELVLFGMILRARSDAELARGEAAEWRQLKVKDRLRAVELELSRVYADLHNFRKQAAPPSDQFPITPSFLTSSREFAVFADRVGANHATPPKPTPPMPGLAPGEDV